MAEGVPNIDLDVVGLQSQINYLERSYTEFGSAVQDIAVGTSQDVSSFYTLALGIDLPISAALASLPLPAPLSSAAEGRINFYLEMQQREARRIVENLATMKEMKLDKLFKKKTAPNDPQHQSVEAAIQSAEREVKESKKEANKVFKQVIKEAGKLPKVKVEAEKEAKETKSKIEENLLKLYKGVGDLLKKLPDQLSQLGGGFVSGLFGVLSVGYKEKDRKRAELGEMANVFESSVDTLSNQKTKKVVRRLSKFAEHAQWRYRLGREKVQGVAKFLVDAGVSSDDMWKQFDRRLGKVGQDVMVASLALDKHMNIADGTAMERSVGFMHNYGMDSRKALKSYMKISGAAQRSRIGNEKFISAILKSEDAVTKLGGNVEFVAVTVNRITDYYEKMGLNKKFAGHQAVGVAVDLFDAFKNIGDKLKIELMRDVTGDQDASGMDLIVQYSDSLNRVKDGKSDEFLAKLLKAFSNVIVKQLQGGRAQRIMAISDILSVSTGDAALVYDLIDTLGETGKLEDLNKDQRRKVKDAFREERTAVSTFDVTRRDLIDVISSMSEGLFGVLSNIVALLIVGVKTFPALYYGIKSGQTNLVMDRLWEKVSAIWGDMGTNWQKMEESLFKASQTLSNQFPATLGPIMNLFFGRQKYYKPPVKGELDKLAGMSLDELRKSRKQKELADRYMRGEDAPKNSPEWMKDKTKSGDLVWMNKVAIDPYTGKRWSAGGRELSPVPGTYDPTTSQMVEGALDTVQNLGKVTPLVGGVIEEAAKIARFGLDKSGVVNVQRKGKTHGEIVKEKTRDYIKQQAKRRLEQDTGGKFTFQEDSTAKLSGEEGMMVVPAALAASRKAISPPD